MTDPDSDALAWTPPDYRGGSTLNLMQTIASGLSAGPAVESYDMLRDTYGPLVDEFRQSRHVILVVVDGLGSALLQRHAPAGWMESQRRGTLTSVFPSTTASAIPTLMSGLAPKRHGLLGWHLFDEGSRSVVSTLPLTPRDPEQTIDLADLASRFISYPSIASRIPGPCSWVCPVDIAGSRFDQAHRTTGPCFAFQNLDGFEQALESACDYHRIAQRSAPGSPGFTYAYLPYADTAMHRLGTSDPRIGELIQSIDRCLQRVALSLAGACMVVTADHGFIDAPIERLIEIDDQGPHAAWLDFLDGPLWGERRIAFAKIRPGRMSDFEAFVRNRHGDAIFPVPATEFTNSPWLGSGAAHSQLASRLGDIVLMMREDWTVKDWIPGEPRYRHLGVHGGPSSLEMLVPLVVAS